MNYDPRKAIRQAMMIARQQVTAPNKTAIGGQRHMLAYITPYEAELLMRRGGSGRMTQYGVPAFDDGDGGNGGGNDSNASQDTAMSDPNTQTATSGNEGSGAGPTGAGAGAIGQDSQDDVGGPPGPPGGPNSGFGSSINQDPEATQAAANMATAVAAQQAGRGVGIADTGGAQPTGFGAAPGIGEVMDAYDQGLIGLAPALGYAALSAFSPPGVRSGTVTDDLGTQTPGVNVNYGGMLGGIAGAATGVPGAGIAGGLMGSAIADELGVPSHTFSFADGGAATGGRMDPRMLPGIHVRVPHERVGRADGGPVQQPQDDDVRIDDPIIGYHGTPHEFDRFDPSKIGTGEGEQMYGHGLYFGEQENTAKYYRDRISTEAGKAKLLDARGNEIALSNPANAEFKKFLKTYSGGFRWGDVNHHVEALKRKSATLDDDINSIDEMLRTHNWSGIEDTQKYWQNELEKKIQQKPTILEFTNALERAQRIEPIGHMYEVAIHARPEEFMDWDKPLSQQNQRVRDFFKQRGFDKDFTTPRGYTQIGGDVYIDAAVRASNQKSGFALPADRQKLSEDMLAAGIPGIKYLDAGSRDAGEGTRNYVVFHPKHLEIKRRYADGGAVDPFLSNAVPIEGVNGASYTSQADLDNRIQQAALGQGYADGGDVSETSEAENDLRRRSTRHRQAEGTRADYRDVILPAVRAFTSIIAGEKQPITEKFFTPRELEILRQATERAQADNRSHIGYEDYNASDPNLRYNINSSRNIINALFDRRGSLANTLGHAPFERTPEGDVVIRDRYDFHGTPEQLAQYSGISGLGRLLAGSIPYGPMGALNALGNYFAPQGQGRPVEIRMKSQQSNLPNENKDNDYADGGNVLFPIGSDERKQNFRDWFGNSKMIDENGEPMVLYHATSKNFSNFKPGGDDPTMSGRAIWLTPNKEIQPAAHNTMQLDEGGKKTYRSGANVMPVHAKIEKPLYITDQFEDADARKYKLNSVGFPMSLSDESISAIRKDGYDGIIYARHKDPEGYDWRTGRNIEVIAFHPKQIKSAIGNRGTYNPNDANITRADGGQVPMMNVEDDPTVQQALNVTRQVQPEQSPIPGAMQVAQTVTAPGRRRFEIAPARVAPMTIDQKDRDLPEEGSVTIKRLTDAFKKAIDNHLSLPPAQQIANARQAENNVAQYVGRGKTGKINSVLTANKKLMKAQTAGEDDTPLTLPDGRTLEMTGLALMPDYREGQFKMCGNSDVCRDLCLGKESGQYRYDPTATQAQMPTTKEELAAAGGKPRMAAFRRTQAMMRDPESFAVYLHELIDGAKIMAEKRGAHLGVRLNVLSDLSPKIMEPIIKAHPEVSFYDYTKMNYDPVAPNHHYTYSSTGLSQPDRGVENPYSNWRKMRDRLDQGHNVAMAFAHGKSDAFPEHLHDEETGKKYRVVSGDEHDFRPMDMVPDGEDGVIIALKNMAASNSEYKYENAAKNSHGFFVHHDPDFERTPKGTFALDENGNRISRNKVYTVRTQPMKRGAMRQQDN